MNHLLTWPALGASILLAAAGGIQLGESTIGMINPVHFQGPAIHPRERGAAVEENQIRNVAEPSFASLYGWDEGHDARLADCGDCGALAARDAYMNVYQPEVRVHRAGLDQWDEPAGAEAEHWGIGGPDEIEIRDLDAELRARVTRYAYYEIEAPAEEFPAQVAVAYSE